LYRQAFQKI